MKTLIQLPKHVHSFSRTQSQHIKFPGTLMVQGIIGKLLLFLHPKPQLLPGNCGSYMVNAIIQSLLSESSSRTCHPQNHIFIAELHHLLNLGSILVEAQDPSLLGRIYLSPIRMHFRHRRKGSPSHFSINDQI
jgi:hypothetical protein